MSYQRTLGTPGNGTFVPLTDSRLKKSGWDLREFGTGVGVGNSTADTAALTAAWAFIASKAASSEVTSSPTDQYNISQSTLLLPPGSITYDGTGLSDSAVTDFTGRFAVRGSYQGASEIRLSNASGRLFDIGGGALSRFDLTDFQLRGGIGLFRHTRTASNIFGDMAFRRLVLRDYTGCAIEYNSQNMPYVIVEGSTFRGHDTLATMGIALSGIANGSHLRNNRFLLNRVHVKLRQGGNDVYLDGNDWLRFSTDRTNGPCTDLWLVPDTTASITATNGDGAGTHLTRSNKLGNENFQSGDYKVLVADEDTGSGSGNGTYWPNTAAASTGNLENVTISPQVYGTSTALRSPVFSTTPNLYGLDVNVHHRGGSSLPDYVVELSTAALAAAGTDVYRQRGNRISIQGRSVGIDKIVKSSNLRGLGTLIDPSGQVAPLIEGGAAAPDYASIFSGVTGVTGWTSGGGASKGGISDAYGTNEGNAVEVTMVAGATLTGTLSSGGMVVGHKHFVEFVLRAGSADSMPQIGFRLLDPSSNVLLQQIIEVPTDGRPWLVRLPFVPLVAGGTAQFYVVNTATDLPGSGPSGKFRVEWMTGYQGREPIQVQPRRTALALLAGLKVKTSGTDARAGQATLASGTVTVSTTAVTNSSLIIATFNGTQAGVSGILTVNARTSGTSFTLVSQTTAGATQTGDNRTVNWFLVEPTS